MDAPMQQTRRPKQQARPAKPFLARLIQRGKMDVTFFALILVLVVVGLIALFSSSYAFALQNYGNSYHFITKQVVFAVIGVACMYLASRVDYHIYRKFAWAVYILSVVLLIVVLLLPPLQPGFDYKRWIVIGPINFQPSEIAKFAIVLLFSHLISNNYKQMQKGTFGILFLGVLLMIVCALVVVETHLSATLLIFSIGAALMIIGGIKLRYVFGGLIGGVSLAAAAILSGLVDYGGDRIKSWLDPWSDVTGQGWQTIQSLLSIGSGGFLGRGIGESRQKYLWVPEPHNDFIFAIICEETGFIGAMVIIALFALLIWRGFAVAMRAPDKFGCLMAIGLTFQVGLQAVLNIMVVTNTIPNTGISLPFFSYGGTALIMLLSEMGVVLSISRASTVVKT